VVMDADAFGLSRDPFERSPDLDDACLPNSMAALLSELSAGLRCGQGVSVLVADEGGLVSMLSGVFVRRVAASGRVAWLRTPPPSAAAIARDALVALKGGEVGRGEDAIEALRSHVVQLGLRSEVAVVVVSDAHKLSPQTLEDLARCFEDDEEDLPLHLFLIGEPGLIDRIQAGPARALESHLLQACRVVPLGLRESIRYLERRLALCGGEFGRLFDDRAIDELVELAGGSLPRLEALASRAFDAAARRRSAEIRPEDVTRAACVAGVHGTQTGSSPARQEPFDFDVIDRGRLDLDDDDAEGAAPEVDDDVWTDASVDEDDAWEAVDEERDDGDLAGFADPDPAWDNEEETDNTRADQRAADPDEPFFGDDGPRPAVPASEGEGRGRHFGRAVLSVAACLGLLWLANLWPSSAEIPSAGRDAVLFSKPVASDPVQILRLPSSREVADANGHVRLWAAAAGARPAAGAPADGEVDWEDELAALETMDLHDAIALGVLDPIDPPPPSAAAPSASQPAVAVEARPAVAAVPPPSAKPLPRPVTAKAPGTAGSRPAPAKTAPPPTDSVRVASAPVRRPSEAATSEVRPYGAVFTVQLGAFKHRRNAEELAARLRGRSARILHEGDLYRVVSGAFASRAEAIAHEASLKRAGYGTFVRIASF
jgi:cell division protein FtsN/type II secretory pathway predicted ATPase ExeA